MKRTLDQQRTHVGVEVGGSVLDDPRAAMCYVKHSDAMLFCERMTQSEAAAGRLSKDWIYRLPTEAEWEYACRAGTTTAYWWGGRLNDNPEARTRDDVNYPSMKGVEEQKKNAWGIGGLLVQPDEWVLDDYTAELPGGEDPLVDRSFPTGVVRGMIGSSNRIKMPRNISDGMLPLLGLRVALVRTRK